MCDVVVCQAGFLPQLLHSQRRFWLLHPSLPGALTTAPLPTSVPYFQELGPLFAAVLSIYVGTFPLVSIFSKIPLALKLPFPPPPLPPPSKQDHYFIFSARC